MTWRSWLVFGVLGVLHEPFGRAGALGLALILLGSWLSTGRAPAVLESELGAAR